MSDFGGGLGEQVPPPSPKPPPNPRIRGKGIGTCGASGFLNSENTICVVGRSEMVDLREPTGGTGVSTSDGVCMSRRYLC